MKRLSLLLAVCLALLFGVAPLSPAAAVPGWELVGRDDFNGPLPAHWSAYDGDPTCCAATLWRPSQVTTQNGALRVISARQPDGSWLSGGLSAAGWPEAVRTYGRYEARIKLDRGTGVSGVALLWPVAEHWPPEIDYFEVWGEDPDRHTDTMTTHRIGDNGQDAVVYHGDLSTWHTIAVEWLPNSLAYLIDGKVVGSVTDPSLIPKEPMWPAFQTHVELCDDVCPNASTPPTVSMWIDWIAVYRPVAAAIPTTVSPPTAVSPTGIVDNQPLWSLQAAGVVAVGMAVTLLALWIRRRRLRSGT